MSRTRWFVPELHDVTPANRDGFGDMLALLQAYGDDARDSAAVLVVPDWGGHAPVDSDMQLLAQLRALPGEKVLHGCTHERGASVWDRLWYGTPNEGEFARASAADANERLARAVALYTRAFGANPAWFCAPRWQQSTATRRALIAHGVRALMMRDACVLANGRVVNVPAVWFDDGERALTRAGARIARRRRITRVLAESRPFRLALHPRDARFADTRHEIVALLAHLRDDGWTARGLDAIVEHDRVAAA